MFKSHYVGDNKIAKKLHKAYANKLTTVKRWAKKLYFQSELENCKDGGRKTWDLRYSLLPCKKTNNVLKLNQVY